MKYDLLTFHSVRVLKADKSSNMRKKILRIESIFQVIHYIILVHQQKLRQDFAGTTISLVFIAVPFPKLDVSEVV